MRIGTAERDSTFLTQGLALARILEAGGIAGRIEVLESAAASIENAKRLHSGDLDFGFMAANWIGRARMGEAPFTEPIDLRMVAPMNAGPLFFVARADSELRTTADLPGKRIVVGPQMSGMAQHARAIFAALGFGFADFTPLYLDFAAGAEALVAGEADAQLQCPIPNKVMTELARRIDVRVLAFAEGELARVLERNEAYRRTLMPKGAIRGLDADIAQPAVVNVLVCHARAQAEMVHSVVRAILAGADELGRINPLFLGLRDLFEPLRGAGPAALQFGGVALHPGALGAYREALLLP
jgi:TRAP transporter TAXI family solute receptor